MTRRITGPLLDAGLMGASEVDAPRGVRWLVLVRLAMVVLCISVLLLRGLARTEPTFGPPGLLVFLAIMGGLALGYFVVLPWIRRGMSVFLLLQFFLDVVAITVLVFFTGGVDSNFVSLYFIAIVAAAMLLSRRDSALFASLATVGVAVVTILYRTETGMDLVDPAYHGAETGPPWPAVGRMLLVAVAFFVVAYLSALLAGRLELARSLNEEILQNMEEGVAVFDERDRLVFVNAEFAQLFPGRTPIQLGDRVEEVFALPEDEPLRKLIVSRTLAQFELPERTAGELPRPPVEIRTSLLGRPPRIRGVAVLVIDLTLHKRAETAERRAQRFSAISEMAASLAHEIRNPLTSVRGSIQGISADFPDGSPNRRLAEIAVKECDRLDRIITHFLQYARARPVRPVHVRLGELLREVETLLARRPEADACRIRLELGEDVMVRCDADQMREVFLNLGLNALSAMAETGGSLTLGYPRRKVRPPGSVFLKRRNEERGVAVSFADTGPGLEPGTEEKVFEPFFTTKARGSGLGLATSQRVVQAHDGFLWVESEPGRGATFYVWLPVGGPFQPGVPEVEEGTAAGADGTAPKR